jgi:hypothetical protein
MRTDDTNYGKTAWAILLIMAVSLVARMPLRVSSTANRAPEEPVRVEAVSLHYRAPARAGGELAGAPTPGPAPSLLARNH